jgi:hypothetical protein
VPRTHPRQPDGTMRKFPSRLLPRYTPRTQAIEDLRQRSWWAPASVGSGTGSSCRSPDRGPGFRHVRGPGCQFSPDGRPVVLGIGGQSSSADRGPGCSSRTSSPRTADGSRGLEWPASTPAELAPACVGDGPAHRSTRTAAVPAFRDDTSAPQRGRGDVRVERTRQATRLQA